LKETPNLPSTDFVFDLPDIVAAHETLWGEIQLEAFGARQVKPSTIVLYCNSLLTKHVTHDKI
jgi:hypothetical protein